MRFLVLVLLCVGTAAHAEMPVPEPPPPPARSWERVTGVTTTGVGAATMIIGLVAGGIAKVTYDDGVKTGCDLARHTCTSDGLAQIATARTEGTVSTVLVAAGAAVTAAGIYFLVTAPRRDMQLAVSPAGVGVAVAGSW
jgi:hypothetical protein